MDMEIDVAFAIAFVALIAGLFLGPLSRIDEFLHQERNPWENGQDS
jgi:hypothetical protein